MPERKHFNPKKAVRELLAKKPAAEVFAGVLQGQRMPSLDIYDFAKSYILDPNNTDPRKAVVSTCFTALSIDAAVLLRSKIVSGEAFPFKLSDQSQGDMVDQYLEPLVPNTYDLLTMNVSSLANPGVPKPHFDLVFKSMSQWIKPFPGEVAPLLSRVLSNTGTLLKANGPDYPALLRDVAVASTGQAPTYEQLLEFVTASSAILSLPASKDVGYINSVRVFAAVNSGWDDKLVYWRENFNLDLTGAAPKVIIRPGARVLMEKDWTRKKAASAEKETPKPEGIMTNIMRLLRMTKPEPKTIIAGCPAMHGGLIDAGLDLYVRSVRARTIPETN